MSTTRLVRMEQEGNVLIVSPLFSFTHSEAELYSEWAALERKLHAEGVQHVTIDLGEIPYFGSTVLEWMVLIWKRIRARGGRLVICNCSEMGHDILKAARFDSLWQICDNRAGAIATFAQPV
jgi:anti-anti-sigma factor